MVDIAGTQRDGGNAAGGGLAGDHRDMRQTAFSVADQVQSLGTVVTCVAPPTCAIPQGPLGIRHRAC